MARLATVVIGALALSSCASTTIDSATTTPAAVTTTTLPSGTPAELLPRLVVETGALSEAIGSRGDKAGQLAIIESVWRAVKPQLEATDGLLVLDIEGALDLCRNAERFNRPADADKCFRNLTALVDAYLAGA